jgi:orotate phosphoribosyltransferase
MISQSLKQNYIQGLLDTKAVLIKSIDEEPFTLRSGRESYMFFDHSKLAILPMAYKAFIDGVQYLLKQTYGDNEFILCNVDSKISAQMVGSVAYNLNKPQIIYKSEAMLAAEKGTQRQMTGESSWDMPVAILDDVSTGKDGTAKGVGDLVKKTFSKVNDIQIFVGFIRIVGATTYKMHYLITQDELLSLIWKDLTSKQQQAIEKERDSKN